MSSSRQPPSVGLSRRALLSSTAAGLALAGTVAPSVLPCGCRSHAHAAEPMARPRTTLDRTSGPGAAIYRQRRYRRLEGGPGWPMVVREDLAPAAADRQRRRRALASFVHLTDMHLVDAASPGRVAFLRQYPAGAAGQLASTGFAGTARAQEAMTTHVAEAMVRRINALGAGPITGRPFDCAISTGDSADSCQYHELDVLVGLLDGSGPLSMFPRGYAGLQKLPDGVDPQTRFAFWQPDRAGGDRWQDGWGFPSAPGLTEAVARPFQPMGLPCPWYGGFGNHDGLFQGVVPGGIGAGRLLERLATGSVMPTGLPEGMTPVDLLEGLMGASDGDIDALIARMPKIDVPALPGRRSLTRQDFIRRHLASPAQPGPVGHGYTADNLADGTLYFSFPLGDGLLGIMLDSTNPNDHEDGCLGARQFAWLEAQLRQAHSRFLDDQGNWVAGDGPDRLVVLFSHHNSRTFDNLTASPSDPDPGRIGSAELLALLHRFPNLVLWVNGHTHTNRVWAHPSPNGRTGGFWEVNTAAHIDYPQQARLVEIADNSDGSLSITGVMIDHSDPEDVPRLIAGTAELVGDDLDVAGLAALGLELSMNDPAQNIVDKLGAPSDRNVELLIRKPY